MARVGGYIRVTIDGTEIRAKGHFTVNLGLDKNEAVIGAASVHGYKSTPQPSMIEGALTDTQDISLIQIASVTNSTVILEAANGKSYVMRNAYFASEGELSTEEGEFKVKFESPNPIEELGGTGNNS